MILYTEIILIGMTESLAGHKGRRFVQAVQRDAAAIKPWEQAAQNLGYGQEMDPEANQGLTKNSDSA